MRTAESALASGNTVIVTGDPGVGKSLAATHILSRAAATGSHVHRVAGTRALAAVPFAALAALIPAARTENPDPVALIAALADDVSGGDRLLAVENAHDLDDGTAGIIAQVAAATRTRLLLTTTEVSRLPLPLAPIALGDDVTRIALGPFTYDDVAEFLEAELGGIPTSSTITRLRGMSDENPLLLRELTRDATASGALRLHGGFWTLTRNWSPSGTRIAELIASRFATLPATVREFCEQLAIVGEIPLTLIERLPSAEAMPEAVAADLVSIELLPNGSGSAFGEPMVRLATSVTADAATSHMSLPTRRAHTAAILTAIPADALPAQARIRLSLSAVASGLEIPAEVLAGDTHRASQLRQHSHAVTLGSAALHGGQLPDQHADATLRVEYAVSLHELNRADEALEALAHLIEAREPRAVMLAAYIRLCSSDDDAGADALLAPQPGDLAPDELAAFRDTLAVRSGRIVDADRLREHSKNPNVSADTRLGAIAHLIIALAYAGDPEGARQEALTALSSALWHEATPAAKGTFVHAHGTALFVGGSPVDDVKADMTGVDWETLQLSHATFNAGAALMHLDGGNAAVALSMFQQSLVMLDEGDPHGARSYIAANAAHAAAVLGDAQLAAAMRDEYLRTTRGGTRMYLPDARRLVLFATALIDGVWAAAAESDALLAFCQEHGLHTVTLRVLHDRWRLGIDPVPTRLIDASAAVSGPGAAAIALQAKGTLGDPVALEASIAAMVNNGRLLFAAETAAYAARGATLMGDRTTAGVLLDACFQLIAPLGPVQTPLLGRASLDHPELSEREREVASRAAEGSTNAEIASELFLSPRTVEGHLQRAYGKLGIADRRQLIPSRKAVQDAVVSL